MTSVQPGQRVSVFDSVQATGQVRLYGHGVYEGVHLIPQWRHLASEMLPLQLAVWQRELARDERELVAESLRLLEAERQLLAEQGRDSEARDVDEPTARQIVHRRREELTARLRMDHEQQLQWMAENSSLLRNPRMRLDDGRTVWGYESWWVDEPSGRARIKQLLSEGYEVIEV
jgi:hypothetical protein